VQVIYPMDANIRAGGQVALVACSIEEASRLASGMKQAGSDALLCSCISVWTSSSLRADS
jgi:hypothetical protein